ncbi:MAG: PHP-associated domain-containing protein [Thermoplasmata archaeon]|nr:PHP-associated domain-containing protein [Thermoplasmata archaeon]
MSKEDAGHIRFETPRLSHLREEGLHPVDMHFHTNHSDAFTRVGAALSLARKRGVGLALTDHNSPSGVVEAHRRQEDVLVIPGMEVSVWDGPHVLLYFYSVGELVEFYRREVEKRRGKSPYLAISLTTLELLDRTTDYNCVRAAAHPFGYLVFNRGVGKAIEEGSVGKEILSRFQALEVINGSMTHRVNLRASEVALQEGLGRVGGTDGHTLGDLGRVVTCTESSTLDGFLDDIVRGQSAVVGREKNVLGKALTATMLVTRFLPYTVPSLVVHYRQNLPRVKRKLRGK